MYENNLFIEDGIIYDTTYGFGKQYRCEDSMWILYVLAFKYRVIIDRCINDPVSFIIKIDGINGSNKTYKKIYMVDTVESNNKTMIPNVASMICDKNK